jgi:uncharacterized protein
MNRLISMTEKFVRKNLEGYDSGHDWHHIDRVRKLALYIGSREGTGNRFIIELSALLHDTGDKKFRKQEESSTGDHISGFLKGQGVEDKIIDEIIRINRYISFSSVEKLSDKSVEFMIVQDADRLDAIGAIGVARAFNYGGFRNNPIYDPDLRTASTIGHFYDKLLKLSDLMNTTTGRSLAEERHLFLEKFLEQFFKEWESGNNI